jgi:hypothetical protein
VRIRVTAVVLFAMGGATALLAGARVAEAGPSYSLGRKAACAEKAVEVELKFAHSATNDRLVERAVAGRRAFPSQIQARAIAGARVTASFFDPSTAAPPALPSPLVPYLPDRVWRAGYERGHLRALVFVRRLHGKPAALFGVEGAPTDIDPDYAEIRAALLRYARWREHPGSVEVISEAERTLASTPNLAVATLASSFLCSAGRSDAIARAARAATPASALAGPSRPAVAGPCPPPVESCSDW